MLLKSVDIQGFKTFPDKTSLKFEENMVAVVGPNGSGKSNVSDAIRWVLGEQSTRILRCSKMEDVIFKGTTQRNAVGFAQVTMNIDNSDRTLNFDSDNLSITRRYYRSGESEYLINKAVVRLKDINELFMDTGLGRDGYSIIGQGKIDSIVAAKSDERREIFEEASGISRYRYRKQESERRLAKTEDNLVRLRDIVSELEQRVEPLRIQSEKAQKFVEFSTEKRNLEIGLWLETLESSGKILRDFSEKIQITTLQYNNIEDELENINKKNQETFQRNAYLNSQIESGRTSATAIDENIVRSQGEISVFINDITHNNNNIDRVKNEIDKMATSREDIETQIANNQSIIQEKSSFVSVYNKEYMELSDKLESLRKHIEIHTSEFDSINQQSNLVITDIASSRVKLSSLTSLQEEITNRGDGIDIAILEGKNSISELETQLQNLITEFSAFEEKKIALNNSVGGYTLKLSKRQEKSDLLKQEIDKLNLDANEALRRAKILEDLDKNLEGFAYSVKTIIKDSARGFLKGIHGPVSKIIDTKPQYSVAIETALGASVQNIVVGTEQDAKNAINHLKKNNGGRATFLPLSTIKGTILNENEFEDIFGFVGIAANLVKCENIYNGIKASLLGRIIIAEDLDSAVVIAKKTSYRYRIVSLDGQVINSGGSLTGGSQTKNTGLLSRSSDIQKYKEKADQFITKVQEKTLDFQKLQAEIGDILAETENLKLELISISEDSVRNETRQHSTQREILNAKTSLENLVFEKENSKQRLIDLTKECDELLSVINDLELRLQVHRENIDNLNLGKETIQSECDILSDKMQQLKITVFSLEKDMEAMQSTINLLVERNQNSSSVHDELNEELTNFEANIDKLTSQVKSTEEKISEMKLESDNIRENVSSLMSQRDENEKLLTSLREEEKKHLTDRENSGKELARLQERSENLQKDYDNIIKKLWDDYELTKSEAMEQCAEISDIKAATSRLNELKNKIRALGSVNPGAIEEYKEVRERYDTLSEQVTDVEKSKEELIKLINELTKHMQELFSVRFSEISSNFTDIFRELFGGGSASLSFTNPEDILNSGIDIKVHPPGKIVSHIEALSGGEKALVAISIYFAIMKVNPPPFCMLDEVEAALDDVNVRRFADYLKRINRNTQFIVITHRRGTMECADVLYGVTMQDDGISKLLSLKAYEVEEKLGIK